MLRSGENRYLPRSVDRVRANAAHTVDLAADRDNFRDSEAEIGSLVTATLTYT
jgi:hypothetical protein